MWRFSTGWCLVALHSQRFWITTLCLGVKCFCPVVRPSQLWEMIEKEDVVMSLRWLQAFYPCFLLPMILMQGFWSGYRDHWVCSDGLLGLPSPCSNHSGRAAWFAGMGGWHALIHCLIGPNRHNNRNAVPERTALPELNIRIYLTIRLLHSKSRHNQSVLASFIWLFIAAWP